MPDDKDPPALTDAEQQEVDEVLKVVPQYFGLANLVQMIVIDCHDRVREGLKQLGLEMAEEPKPCACLRLVMTLVVAMQDQVVEVEQVTDLIRQNMMDEVTLAFVRRRSPVAWGLCDVASGTRHDGSPCGRMKADGRVCAATSDPAPVTGR